MPFDLSKTGGPGGWHTTDDVVMGGLSASRFYVDPSGIGVFEGNVSLENNGGFSSLKRRIAPGVLSGSEGIRFRARGGGKHYKLYVKDHENPGGINMQCEFETRGDEWKTHTCPFSDFVSTYKGRQVESAGPLDPSGIVYAGFIISKGQAGFFKLEIEWIEGYRESES